MLPNLVPIGFEQITSLSASTALTVPTAATAAFISVETQNVRWRADGTAPTASVGHRVASGSSMLLVSFLTQIRFIEEASGAKLNVTYFRG